MDWLTQLITAIEKVGVSNVLLVFIGAGCYVAGRRLIPKMEEWMESNIECNRAMVLKINELNDKHEEARRDHKYIGRAILAATPDDKKAFVEPHVDAIHREND